jgi:hypothetical protein
MKSLLFVQFGLTPYTQTHSSNGLTPCLWYLRITFFAAGSAFATGDATASHIDGILHTGIDLILYRFIA